MLSCSVVSDSSRPHGPEPARLLCPWDSPGENAGAGGHFLLQGSPWRRDWARQCPTSPVLAGGFFATEPHTITGCGHTQIVEPQLTLTSVCETSYETKLVLMTETAVSDYLVPWHQAAPDSTDASGTKPRAWVPNSSSWTFLRLCSAHSNDLKSASSAWFWAQQKERKKAHRYVPWDHANLGSKGTLACDLQAFLSSGNLVSINYYSYSQCVKTSESRNLVVEGGRTRQPAQRFPY